MNCLEVKNLTLSYERHPAVHHASVDFKIGSSTAILGPNGAGKSTFLKALAGLHPIDEGSIARLNIGLNQTAYLSQSIGFEKDFPLTVEEVIKMGFLKFNKFWPSQKITSIQKQILEEAIEWTQLQALKTFPLRKLSIGQLQRVRWARLIVQNPDLILMDEPFSGLDEHTIEHLTHCLKNWKQKNKTIIIILHDHKYAIENFSHLLYIDRSIHYYKPTFDLKLNPQFKVESICPEEAPLDSSNILSTSSDDEVCSV